MTSSVISFAYFTDFSNLDLSNAITLGNVFMYADNLYCVGKNFDQVCLQLNSIL